MQEFVIKGQRKICFLVKKGTVKDIVIPVDGLAPIDYKRLYEMEKRGGELMRVMRDTTLDNGVNALVMYKDMFREIDATPSSNTNDGGKEVVVDSKPVVKKKRGRGRPRKNA